MYSIYADGVCIYNDVFSLDNMKVVNPKLTLEDSAAGSLEMTLPPTNAAYDTIVRMVTDISVKRTEKRSGRDGPCRRAGTSGTTGCSTARGAGLLQRLGPAASGVCREIGPGVPRPAHRHPQRAGG